MKRWKWPLLILILLLSGFFVWRYLLPVDSTPQELTISEELLDVLQDSAPTISNLPSETDNSETNEFSDSGDNGSSEEAIEETTPPSGSQVIVPATASLDVPFIVQAPNANWTLPYKEACEEASVMMIHHFYLGGGPFSQDQMKAELDKIIPWGEATFGSYDTDAADTAKFFTEKLGYDPERVHVVYDMTLDDVKAAVLKGIPVIVPAAGRELENRYFQTPGPLYHMLVLTGYSRGQFITNDPGTRNGEGYKYDEQVLFNAIHDLTPNIEQISTGRKAMILVTPPRS